MGAWGAGIFDDDTAADLRADYRELLKEQVDDVEATDRILEEYRGEEPSIVAVVLAAAQVEFGRLESRVTERALEVIERGEGLELWDDEELPERAAVLAALKQQLTGEQRPRKRMRRTWRYHTDLRVGDVLSFADKDAVVWVYWVVRIEDDGLRQLPVVQSLVWWWRHPPTDGDLERLRSRWLLPRTHRITRLTKSHPDWMDAGFRHLGTVAVPRRKRGSRVWGELTWPGLAEFYGA